MKTITTWHRFSTRVSQRLSWKLAFSHLKVVIIAQVINLIGFGVILIFAGQPDTSFTQPDSLINTDSAALMIRFTVFGILFLLVTLISSGVATSIGVVLAQRFGYRLQALAEATEAVTRGDLSARIDVNNMDEIGQIAVRFNLLMQQLEAVNHARRSFVSNISHELRTPLTIIRSHVEAQLTHNPMTLPQEMLITLEREVQTLGHLIDDLFTLSRIEEAILPIQPQALVLQPIVEAALNGIRPIAGRQGHIVAQSMLPVDLPPAQVDPVRLDQILNNLLYNALRHTPNGGIIVVEGQVLDDKMVELAVTDTGVGIDRDDLPHIFERYFYGENNHASGSGLGLAIVRELVEAQGGTIWAESSKGQGTTVRFTLPLA